MGLEPGEFWRLTPAELNELIEGYRWRDKREQDRLAWLAWHVAALQRTKKMPSLKAFLGQAKPAQSREDKEAAFRRLWEKLNPKVQAARGATPSPSPPKEPAG